MVYLASSGRRLQRGWELLGRTARKINLGYVIVPTAALLLFSAPLLRGLFFRADMLLFQMGAGTIFLLALMDAARKRVHPVRGSVPLGFLWMVLAYGLACFGAASAQEAVRAFLRQILYLAVFWLSWYFSREKATGKMVPVILFVSGTVVALIGIAAGAGLDIFPGAVLGSRIMSTLQYPNALAAYMMLTSIIGLTFLTLTESPILRMLCAVGVFAQVLVFLTSYSRAAWVVYPFALLSLLLVLPGRYKLRYLFSACTALVSVFVVAGQFAMAANEDAWRTALKWAIFGGAVSLAVEVARYVYKRVYDDTVSAQVRTALTWAVVGFGVLTLSVYSYVLVSQYGTKAKDLLPPAVIRRFATISLDDRSLLARTLATKDAVKLFYRRPLFGGGGGAWNAWYHQVQPVLYWTTEVHNHFAQVLVETGLFGFSAYMFLWGALVYHVVRFVRRGKTDPEKTYVLGLCVSCLALGAHSAADFELSLPGIGCHLWAAFGAVWATVGNGWVEGQDEPRRTGIRRWLAVGLGLCLLLASVSFHKGAWYGQLGALALVRADYYQAAELYKKAIQYDRFTSSYPFDLGQAYAAQAALGGGSNLREDALNMFDKARKLAPCNITQGIKEGRTRTALGDFEGAWEACRNVARVLPLDVKAWENMAQTGVAYCLYEGIGEGDCSGGKVAAVLQEITGIPEVLEGLKAKIKEPDKHKWKPDKLDVTLGLAKYVGQAHYLLGELEQALGYLELAGDKEGSKWLVAARTLSGAKQPGARDSQVEKILTYYRLVDR